jgi:hypothetical protein
MHRLTQSQLRNAIQDVLEVEFTGPLPTDISGGTFASLGASLVSSNDQDVEQYQAMAAQVADAVAAKQNGALSKCKPTAANDPCIETFLSTMGRSLFRRPLSTVELDAYRRVVTAQGANAAQLTAGLRWALVAMLQAPSFLYQAWDTVPQQAFLRLDGRSLATRLALFAWDSVPNSSLLDAADRGALDTPDGLAQTIKTVLDHPRAAQLGARFFSEAWGVSALEIGSKSNTAFPDWNATLLDSMQREFRALAANATGPQSDVRTLFDGEKAYVDATLAKIYGVPAPASFKEVSLDSRRRGLLTSAAVLAASNTHADASAPILRGLFVLDRLLCLSIPTPPPGLLERVMMEEQMKPPRSNRTQVDERMADNQCSGCHRQMDPIGLAFEAFDGIGRHRTTAGMFPVDSSGSFEGVKVTSVPELSVRLRDDERVTRCMVEQTLSASTGHVLQESEARAVAQANETFKATGYRYRSLVESVLSSDAFVLVAP